MLATFANMRAMNMPTASAGGGACGFKREGMTVFSWADGATAESVVARDDAGPRRRACPPGIGMPVSWAGGRGLNAIMRPPLVALSSAFRRTRPSKSSPGAGLGSSRISVTAVRTSDVASRAPVPVASVMNAMAPSATPLRVAFSAGPGDGINTTDCGAISVMETPGTEQVTHGSF